jgi:outer membrane protein assembly factor BamA
MHRLTTALLSLLILLMSTRTFAQVGATDALADLKSFFIVGEVVILGNVRTKPHILTRELDFSTGDTIYTANLKAIKEINENKVFNTGLFVSATIQFAGGDSYEGAVAPVIRNVLIVVKERWFTYPNIIFELADRNLNEWWYDRGRDLSRTDYGFWFTQKNFRGRNEVLSVKLQGGFNQKFDLNYRIPYINKKQLAGAGFYASYATNKNIAIQTLGNKLDFIGSEEVLRTRLNLSAIYTYRSGFYRFHQAELKYNYNTINDTVAALNPSYFLNGKTKQRFFSAVYSYTIDRRNIRAYPLSGYHSRFQVEQLGILSSDDIRITRMGAQFAHYQPLGWNLYLANEVNGRLTVNYNTPQPYNELRALGYGNRIIRGYEYYVIDGQHYVMSKNSLRKRILDRKIEMGRAVPIRQFQSIPIAVYLKSHFDAGYVHDQFSEHLNPRFSNNLLTGAGLGIDIVSYYDAVFRIEYSINRAMERGFFIHLKSDI